MKRNIFYTAALIASAVVLGGCSKDFLDTAPSSQTGSNIAEETAQGIHGIVNGMHNLLYSYSFGQPMGNGHSVLSAHYDMMGDDMINTLRAYHMMTYRYQASRNVTDESGLNFQAWDFYYTVIHHANRAIQAANKISLTNLEKSKILGESYAMRAWAYHNLVQLFAKRYDANGANDHLGVVIRTENNLKEDTPRSSVAQVYAQIDADLQEALTHLEQVEYAGKNHINYATACGIAARVALSKSDWDSAKKYAQLVIERSGATLASGDALLDGFNQKDASEWIWGYTQNTQQNYYYDHFNAAYSYNFHSSHTAGFRYAVNRDIYDKMGEEDIRRKWWVCLDKGDAIPDDAFSDYFMGGTQEPNWEITGQQVKFKSAGGAGNSKGDTLLMRLGEMYYILAEAQARLGEEAAATATLMTIMQTRDAQYSIALSGAELVDEIMRNKRIDLWMEGQRFFDMKRLGVVPNRLNSSNIQKYLSGPAKETAIGRNSGNNTVFLPTSADSKYWQFAIPFAEIRANKLCVQNEL